MRISDWSSDVCSSDRDARKITHETRTGDRAWAIAWVIADGRGCNSPSARFFSAMNDRRYEILIDGELLVDPISQLTADVTVVSEIGRASCRERVCQYV